MPVISFDDEKVQSPSTGYYYGRNKQLQPSIPVFLGVDSNKRPIKTDYGDHLRPRYDASPISVPPTRYPNYLPQLRAKRLQTATQSSHRLRVKDQMNRQRVQEEGALNAILNLTSRTIRKDHWTAPIPELLPVTPTKNHEILLPNFRSSNPSKYVGPREVQSLYRASPTSFSDSNSPVLQVELAAAQRKRNHSIPRSSLRKGKQNIPNVASQIFKKNPYQRQSRT